MNAARVILNVPDYAEGDYVEGLPERTSEDFPIFYRFGWGGVDSPEFRSALIAAYRHVGMEDLSRRYESYGRTGRMELLSA